ncbi:MAG: precorrin-6A synthase (deacetylating) [Acidimicrobiales bacterium]|nr:precorrin-6A synthase (deacetylating) [Acidimicrobiales bacterium]
MERAECPRRRIAVVGIGAGDPRFVTVEALQVLASLDVIIVFDKGDRAGELRAVREAILDRARAGRACRMIELPDARRDDSLDYGDTVRTWHRGRADALEQVLRDHVGDGEVAGILVWGDPSLYDSTLRILDEVAGRGNTELEVQVVPGVSSLHVLAARHGIPLHAIGGSVLITTGRRLREGIPAGIDDVVVFLDANCSFMTLRGGDWEIYWGAFLGMPDEQLIVGRLDEVATDIVQLRERLRAEHGWVFDCYLLRRR